MNGFERSLTPQASYHKKHENNEVREPHEPPRKRRLVRAAAAAFAGLAAATSALCSCARPASHYVIDATMSSAHRPEMPARAFDAGPRTKSLSVGPSPLHPSPKPGPSPHPAPRYELLAGDLHCHVGPPDHPPHVTRGPADTVELARTEGLDFVVLTPHVGARFFQDEEHRAYVVKALARLKREISALASGKTVFITGIEYTDHSFGHVGAAFADFEEVLAAVPVSVASRHPERFFEEYVARGGVLVVNHPLVTPLDSIIPMARADLSWRPFTSAGPFPPEIRAVNRLAHGFEAYNLTTTHLRDRYLLNDTEHTLRATLRRLDAEILAQQRRMTPVGGSDSHSGHIRGTTFVLSEGRSERAIRDAVVAGRVCVRDPAACSFQARAPGGAWLTVGGSLKDTGVIEARAQGEDIEILVDGHVRKILPQTGEVRIPLDAGRCSVVRARVGEGYSAPIYVNCPFAG